MWLELLRAFIDAHALPVAIGIIVLHIVIFIIGSAITHYKKSYSKSLMALVPTVNASLIKISKGQVPWRLLPDDDFKEILDTLGLNPNDPECKTTLPALSRSGVTYVMIDKCVMIQRCFIKMHDLFLEIVNPNANCTQPFMLLSVSKYISFATIASVAYDLIHRECVDMKMDEGAFRSMLDKERLGITYIENMPGEVYQVVSILLASEEVFSKSKDIYNADSLFMDYGTSFYVLCDMAKKLKGAVNSNIGYLDALSNMSNVVMQTKGEDITNVTGIVRV